MPQPDSERTLQYNVLVRKVANGNKNVPVLLSASVSAFLHSDSDKDHTDYDGRETQYQNRPSMPNSPHAPHAHQCGCPDSHEAYEITDRRDDSRHGPVLFAARITLGIQIDPDFARHYIIQILGAGPPLLSA